MESVILVNDMDVELGVMEKMEAHRKGALHRAISVFVFNEQGDYLLQQRAEEKYHSAGKWSNTCCSHPRPGETMLAAANRRLKEEMGLDCKLAYWFSFKYRAELDHGLTEHEYDHVFMGMTNELPHPDPSEVSSFKYISRKDLEEDLIINPDDYSEWFKICLRY